MSLNRELRAFGWGEIAGASNVILSLVVTNIFAPGSRAPSLPRWVWIVLAIALACFGVWINRVKKPRLP